MFLLLFTHNKQKNASKSWIAEKKIYFKKNKQCGTIDRLSCYKIKKILAFL